MNVNSCVENIYWKKKFQNKGQVWLWLIFLLSIWQHIEEKILGGKLLNIVKYVPPVPEA